MAATQNIAQTQTVGKSKDILPRIVRLAVAGQDGTLTVPLSSDGGREYAVVLIDGVRYHLERLTLEELVTEYTVDGDPDYAPMTDKTGHCYLMVPFSR